jgi:hypothetical protein
MHYLIQNGTVSFPSSLAEPKEPRRISQAARTRRSIAITSTLVALTVLSGWIPARPLYLTNDDVAMRLLVEGRFAPGAAPTPFVMFMHIAIGWLLTALYTAASRVPWYDVLMLAAAVAATVAIVAAWNGTSDRLSFLRTLMLSVVLLGPLFATPQFSLIGMTCAATGLMLVIRSFGGTPAADYTGAVWQLCGLCLFALGTLIRWEGAVVLLIQAAFSFPIASLSRVNSFLVGPRRLLTIVTLLAAFPLLAAITNVVVYQRSPGWREFPEFNYTRGMLTEYAPAGGVSPEVMSAVRAKTGWSENDLQLLRGWFFENPSVFSLDKLQAALGVIRHRELTAGSIIAGIVGAIQSLLAQTWVPMLFLLAVSTSTGRPARQFLFTVILLLVFLVVGGSASVWLKDLPFRVYWPMLVLVGVAVSRGNGDSTPRVSPYSLFAIAAVFALIAIPRWQQQQLRAAEAREVNRDVAELSRLEPSLVIIHGDSLRWEYVWHPFSNSRFPYPFLGIGASARTPPVQSVLRRDGHIDLANAICSDDRVVLLARSWLPPALVIFMQEHYSRRVAFDAVFEGRTLTAWRCRADTPRNARF